MEADRAAFVAGSVALVALAAAARSFDEPTSTFTRDVQDYAGVHWYVGAFSMVHIIGWAAVATLSLLVAWLEPGERRRMGLFGGFVLFLMADDAFLLHEAVGPENGVPQVLFMAVYAAAGLVLLVAFLSAPRNGSSVARILGGGVARTRPPRRSAARRRVPAGGRRQAARHLRLDRPFRSRP